MLATEHYTEMFEAQQQKAAAVEEHMLEKATLESKVLQWEHECKEEIHQLQLQLTQMESQYTQSLNFPWIQTEQPSKSRNLWEEVVGVVPGIVNTKQGAAKYNSVRYHVPKFPHSSATFNIILGSHIQAFSQSSYKDHWVTVHVLHMQSTISSASQ